MIRSATLQDAASIAEIYNWYIENTVITFEQVSVTEQEMQARISRGNELHPWFVVEQQDVVSGFAFAAEFKSRGAYRQTVETTIYLPTDEIGRGNGRRLYQHLIDHLQRTSIHVLVSTIALPNLRSIALHEKLGYRKSGHLFEVGRKFDNWVDVEYWQLVFDDDKPVAINQ